MIQNLIFAILVFWKYYFGHTAFLYFSRRSNWHHQTFQLTSSDFFPWLQTFLTKTSKKDHTFYNTVSLNNFTNRNSLDIENNILPQHSQKPFCKFSSRHVSVWCQKKYLHCTLSWRPIIAFLKLFESNCLYISIYPLMKMFLLET